MTATTDISSTDCREMAANKLQLGFYLFEMTVAMIVLCSLMRLGAIQVGKNIQRVSDQITAYQFQVVCKAAHQYVLDNFNSNSPITMQVLKKEGYLGEHVVNDLNNYGQNYKIVKLPNPDANPKDPKVFYLVVATLGGTSISETALRSIAGQVGGNAGYISNLNGNIIQGNQEGWKIDVAGTGISGLKPGHLVSLLIINEHDFMNISYFKDGVLYRKEVKGHPEYNTMEVDLKINKDHSLKIGSSTDTHFSTVKNKSINLQQQVTPTDIWTTSITPSEIRLKGTGSKRESYLGNDFISHKGGNNDSLGELKIDGRGMSMQNKAGDWISEFKPSEINLKSSSSGNTSYLGNDRLKYTNRGHVIEVNASSITASAPWEEFPMYWNPGLRSYWGPEIKAHYIRIPTFFYQKGSGGGIDSIMKKLAESICTEQGAGAMVLASEWETNKGGPIFCVSRSKAIVEKADVGSGNFRPFVHTW